MSEELLPSDLQDRKNEADVAKAEAEAAKAQADVAKAEVEIRKAQLDADKAASAARVEAITALVPDLSKVKASTLTAAEGKPMWATFLTFRAVNAVAERIASSIHRQAEFQQEGQRRILVTTHEDLASGDALYHEVVAGLDQLRNAADKLLSKIVPEFAAELGAVLAAALPSILSIFSRDVSIKTAEASASDLAAAASVTAALERQVPGLSIVLYDFRLAPTGSTVHAKVAEVATRRQRLVAEKVDQSDKKAKAEAALTKAKAAKPRDEDLVERLSKDAAEAQTRLALVDSAIAAIDAFTAAIRTVPEGGTRSPLAVAVLHEALHGEPPQFTHVLLVKAQAGQVEQALDNRPLFFKDKFTTMVDATVVYALIETAESTVVDSGTVTETTAARGKVGDKPTIDPL